MDWYDLKNIIKLQKAWEMILPTIYDESLSYIQKLEHILDIIKKLIESNIELTSEWLKLKDFVDTQIKAYTEDQLQEWLDNGTLANMIMQLGKIVKYFNNVEELKNSNNLQVGQYVNLIRPNMKFIVESTNTAISIPLSNNLYCRCVDNFINPSVFSDMQEVINYCCENKINIMFLENITLSDKLIVKGNVDFNNVEITLNNGYIIFDGCTCKNINIVDFNGTHDALNMGMVDGIKYSLIGNLIENIIVDCKNNPVSCFILNATNTGGYDNIIKNVTCKNGKNGFVVKVTRNTQQGLSWLTGFTLDGLWAINCDEYGLKVINDVTDNITSPGQLTHSLFNNINVQVYKSDSVGVLVGGGGNIYNITSIFDDSDRSKPITAIKYYDDVIYNAINFNGNIPLDYLISGNIITYGMIEGKIEKGLFKNNNHINGYNLFNGVDYDEIPINYFKNASPIIDVNLLQSNISGEFSYDNGIKLTPSQLNNFHIDMYTDKYFIDKSFDYFVIYVRIKTDSILNNQFGFQFFSNQATLLTRIGVTQYIKMSDGYIVRAVFRKVQGIEWNIENIKYLYFRIIGTGDTPTSDIVITDFKLYELFTPYIIQNKYTNSIFSKIPLGSNEQSKNVSLIDLFGMQGYAYKHINIYGTYDFDYTINGYNITLNNKTATPFDVNIELIL